MRADFHVLDTQQRLALGALPLPGGERVGVRGLGIIERP